MSDYLKKALEYLAGVKEEKKQDKKKKKKVKKSAEGSDMDMIAGLMRGKK